MNRLLLLVMLAACDVESQPEPDPIEFRTECPEWWLEAELEFLEEMERAEALAVCRADCTRDHVACLEESPVEACPDCHRIHSMCMDACEAEPVDDFAAQ